MKKLMLTSILAALVALGTTVMAQDYPEEYLGLPGDNLNLYATMKLFQESETLEGFERSLNDENSRINNLDLNGDNYIDYITVSDFPEGDDHTIVLRVALNRKESQDIAVFTVQRFGNGSVQIQLIGDEALYGKNYIIEPIYEETPNPGYSGRPENRTYVTEVRTTPYEIAAWPLIRFIYMPNYVMWRSNWYWGYYPDYWNPWRPYYWDYYYGYHYNWYNDYYSRYHHWDYCRWNRYNDFYYHGMRAYSPTVVININKNVYRNTYSHPEQRKDGEALYTRTNPDRANRTMESRRPATGVRQEATRSSAGQRSDPSNRPQATGTSRQASDARAADRQPATGNRQPAATTRQNETRSSAGQRPDASSRQGATTRPAASTRPATDDGRQATGNRPEASKSSTVQRPAASSSKAETQRTTTVSSSRSSGQSQRNSSASSPKSSGQSQRNSAASSSRSSGQSQKSSATRSSQPGRSSGSSSSSKSSSSKSGSNDSRRK